MIEPSPMITLSLIVDKVIFLQYIFALPEMFEEMIFVMFMFRIACSLILALWLVFFQEALLYQ